MLFSTVTMALFAMGLILFALERRKQEREQFKRPPGPIPWPFIGNLLQMGEQLHICLTRLRDKYGDVFKVKMGSLVVVVLSGYDTIKQALVRQGESFAGRPDLFSFSAVANGTSMTFSEKYGEAWILHKKICKNALRTFSQAKANNSMCSCLLEERICAEASDLVNALSEHPDRARGFDPSVSLVTSVANVVCALCFGKRYEYSDKEFLNIVQINNEENIQEHLNTFDKNCIRDITDALIALSEDRYEEEKQSVLSSTQIVHTVIDIFGAGFDTIIAGLQWSLLYLIKFPDIQCKIYQEIDDKIGSNRMPRFEDKPKMPFTEAFIYEVFRHSSYVPFTIPHCTTENIVLNGYFIPKDTCIFINQYQVNHDPALWSRPKLFQPERFLDASGQLNKDLTDKVMIFGMGKRRCVGDGFARLEMFLFFTTLLHRLQISNVSGQELDLTAEFGLTMKPKPYKIRVSPRY
uniref:Cytochrome P450, family 1, subfamily D, polypeptide 1 n=1 Tax=Scleropages formosus TaxID=113540 RepID=A0A8C9W476_SCLFO